MSDDWFDRLVDQDWAETKTRDRRDQDRAPAGRLPPPGSVIDDFRDLADETSETRPRETSETETRDPAETVSVDLGKNDETTATKTETETSDRATKTETETQPSAYDAIADAILAAADRLPTAEQAAEARRDIVRSKRARAALYNISAASVGLLPLTAGADWTLPGIVTIWIDNIAAEASIGGALVIGTGLAGIVWAAWDRRTRNLPGWAAWACRIPLASVVAGVLLWAPAWPALNL